ncbi:MAG: hypothetical protein WAP51_04550 [Candidatus Sungiibacteriota bacterium]
MRTIKNLLRFALLGVVILLLSASQKLFNKDSRSKDIGGKFLGLNEEAKADTPACAASAASDSGCESGGESGGGDS